MATNNIVTMGLYAPLDSKAKTYNTIADMQSDRKLISGQVVNLQGYYQAGDGAGHQRVIANADDGSGVQLDNGLWANIVHNGEVNVSWFGAKQPPFINNAETYLPKLLTENVIMNGENFIFENNTSKQYVFKAKNCVFKNFVINTKRDIKLQFNHYGNLSIENIIIDGTGMTYDYAGMGNFYDSYLGIGVFGKANEDGIDPVGLEIKNCNISNLTSSNAIFIEHSNNVEISFNTITNCSGVLGLSDADGDGIYNRICKNISIHHNTVINNTTNRAIGRTGICAEYQVENCDIYDNVVEGYDRNIHIEAVKDNINVFRNITRNGRTAFISWTNYNAKIKVFDNIFTNENFEPSNPNNASSYNFKRALIEYKGKNDETTNHNNFEFINNKCLNYINRKSELDYSIFTSEGTLFGVMKDCEFKNIKASSSSDYLDFILLSLAKDYGIARLYNNYIESFITPVFRISDVIMENNTIMIHQTTSHIFSGTKIKPIFINNIIHSELPPVVTADTQFIFSRAKIVKGNYFKNLNREFFIYNTFSENDNIIIDDNVAEYTVNQNCISPTRYLRYDNNKCVNPTGTITFIKDDNTKMVVNNLLETIFPVDITSQLDTPIYKNLMEQEGVYADYANYRVAQLKYEKEQRVEEKAKQEAYEQALLTNPDLTWEDFLKSYPMVIPVLQEPTIPDTIKKFMEDYLI